MKNKMIAHYKPSRNISSGAALQVVRASGVGVYFQIAKQASAMGNGPDKNATFDWQYNSFSAKMKYEELTAIINLIKRGKSELSATGFANKILPATGIKEKIHVDEEVLQELRFYHGSSTAPKNIIFQVREYPVGSGQLTLKIAIYGTMSYRDPKSGVYIKKEKESITINLKEDEFTALSMVFAAEVANQLEDNLIDCTVINESMIDSNGINGFKTIKSVRLPAMQPEEAIIGLRKDLVLVIKRKAYHTAEQKMYYYCVEA